MILRKVEIVSNTMVSQYSSRTHKRNPAAQGQRAMSQEPRGGIMLMLLCYYYVHFFPVNFIFYPFTHASNSAYYFN